MFDDLLATGYAWLELQGFHIDPTPPTAWLSTSRLNQRLFDMLFFIGALSLNNWL